MNDSEYFERLRHVDTINDYNSIIAELQRLYDQTPASDRFIPARIQSGMKKSKRDLAKTQLNIRYSRNTSLELQLANNYYCRFKKKPKETRVC